jgi:RNA polymerase sigma factor (sigma-70 family)
MAEEVVQLAFIKLWNYRSSLNEEFTISTQLFRIATTTLIDLLRKNNHAKELIKELSIAATTQTLDPNEKLNEKELMKEIATTISGMPAIQRRVFEMSRMDGMTYKQIAESLSISVKTVETHISRALKRIKKLLPTVVLIFLFYFIKSKG